MPLWDRQKTRFLTVHDCVFFTQHLPEKRRQDLWEERFFIA
jgi:hypothetical protein